MFNPSSRKGQGLVEYALILVLVSVVVIAILSLLGPQVGNIFSSIIAGLGGNSGAVVTEVAVVTVVPTMSPCDALFFVYNDAGNSYALANYNWSQAGEPASGALYDAQLAAYNTLQNAWGDYAESCLEG